MAPGSPAQRRQHPPQGDQADLLADVTAARDTLQASWQPFAERFAALVDAHAAGVVADPTTGGTTTGAARAASITS